MNAGPAGEVGENIADSCVCAAAAASTRFVCTSHAGGDTPSDDPENHSPPLDPAFDVPSDVARSSGEFPLPVCNINANRYPGERSGHMSAAMHQLNEATAPTDATAAGEVMRVLDAAARGITALQALLPRIEQLQTYFASMHTCSNE